MTVIGLKNVCRKMSLRRFFVLSILFGVVICSATYTLFQTWRDFEHDKQSRTSYQKQISDLMVASLREPLIQGSLVEVNLRVQSFLKQQPQVLCVAIKNRGLPISDCDPKGFSSSHVFETQSQLFYEVQNSNPFAEVRFFYDNSELYGSWKRKLRDALIFNFLIAVLVFSFLLTRVARYLKTDLQTILDECNPETQGHHKEEAIRIKEFSHLFRELKKYIAAARFNAEAHAAGEVARQVAHDIRSPLAALRMTIDSLYNINEHQRKTIRAAFDRINDIANDLMNRAPALGSAPHQQTQDGAQVELINDLVDSIVSEKRIQYRERSSVSVEFRIDKKAHAVFSSISGHRLKRGLSNIIDNSFEAIDHAGTIEVILRREDREIVIVIRDNGKGIPLEILPTLMQKGKTFGKTKGNGLGLYDAQRAIASWGGTLSLESALGLGTTVTIRLPSVDTPKWFPEKIRFTGNTTVVSVDDDISIHEIWRSRFQSLSENFEDLKFLSFSSVTDFSQWFEKSKSRSDCLFLVDFEFLRQSKSGLELIEELGIGENSILVTSRYADQEVSRHAQRLGVPILPKALSGFIPFEIRA